MNFYKNFQNFEKKFLKRTLISQHFTWSEELTDEQEESYYFICSDKYANSWKNYLIGKTVWSFWNCMFTNGTYRSTSWMLCIARVIKTAYKHHITLPTTSYIYLKLFMSCLYSPSIHLVRPASNHVNIIMRILIDVMNVFIDLSYWLLYSVKHCSLMDKINTFG